MIPTAKVLWGEGLFLRPQHFQQQDAYHEWRTAETARCIHPYAWGVRRARVDVAALSSGILRFDELSLAYPDGELYSAPGEDPLPPPLSLAALPPDRMDMVVHAAMAPLRTHAHNAALDQAADDGSLHYRRHAESLPDRYTQAAKAEVAVLHRCVRLLPDHLPHDHLLTMPVCRIRRNASGGYELDSHFAPPVVSIQASPPLQSLVRRLIDMLQAKVDALYGLHREPSKHLVEFRSGDVASFWLLHTASSACASLMHLRHHPQFHPERLFEQLLGLAGALMTFSRGHRLADLPAYAHGAPGAAFQKLEELIRDLLDTVISTRYVSIALSEARSGVHQGRLDSGAIADGAALYLGVSAALAPTELVEAVPLRFKVGAPEDVDKLVLSAMGGVGLTHVTQVPSAIPVRPGAYYFALDGRHPLFERMVQAQSISIYVPSGWPELHLELFALTQ